VPALRRRRAHTPGADAELAAARNRDRAHRGGRRRRAGGRGREACRPVLEHAHAACCCGRNDGAGRGRAADSDPPGKLDSNHDAGGFDNACRAGRPDPGHTGDSRGRRGERRDVGDRDGNIARSSSRRGCRGRDRHRRGRREYRRAYSPATGKRNGRHQVALSRARARAQRPDRETSRAPRALARAHPRSTPTARQAGPREPSRARTRAHPHREGTVRRAARHGGDELGRDTVA